MLAGIVGVVAYVGTWAALGVLTPGYDPVRQAISELFDLGAPRPQAWTLTGVLAVTGLGLLPFGPVLHRRLPGTGRLGPVLAVLAGVGTVLVAFFPCTAGCPGFGTTTTDTMHVVAAGGGYLGLVLAPLAFARRCWGTEAHRLAVAGLVLGGVATLGFVVRNAGVDVVAGLQQRVFNTLADAWYVLAAVWVLRRLPAEEGAGGPGQAGTASAGTDDASDSAPERDSSTAHTTP